ncbi:PTS system transporter subunit IIA [Paenibacillus terrae HPL-003]|uniref:PTS system transporter subunit IIA n=1 Tax=Paenibacillus terrae (strain HPL-003) TaxID=985665 RepID=G7VXY0_PAETH|nr:PTS lactose/cellobiose transporter subunit IIA [Paenibacillus terrae]AET57158.1 PTS system transporter subunit IIA [Paenibacillus terrae HPL-003]
MNNELEKREEIAKVAMQIIMNASDAKADALNALKSLRSFDFEAPAELLKKAHTKIVLAHKAQTNLVQNEASGETYENSLLFNHAQDTLMTAKMQIEISEELCALVRALFNKIESK